MKPFRSAVLLAWICVCIFCPSEGAAQSFVDSLKADTVATPAQVRTLLESSDPREQAWGAWLAGTGKMTEMIPLLERVASERLKGAPNQDNQTLDVALDALIQLDARLAPDFLLTVYPRRAEQALILLSRIGSNGNDALLKLGVHGRDLKGYAVGNLLLRNRAPGFAALLLRDTRISVTVFVVDPGDGGLPGKMWVDGPCGVSLAPPAAGFSPWPRYMFSRPAQSGAIVLVSGPTPVSYVRDIDVRNSFVAGIPTPNKGGICIFDPGPTSADLLAYLAALAPKTPIAITADEFHNVVWRGSDALAAQIEGFREDIRKQYGVGLQNLIAEGLLTPEEASTLKNPNIDVQVRDLHTGSSPK